MRAPWAVVRDFDGTATTEDIGDQVSLHFAGPEVWRRAEDEYRAGALGFGALIERLFAPITASEEQIAAFARERRMERRRQKSLRFPTCFLFFVFISCVIDLHQAESQPEHYVLSKTPDIHSKQHV